MRGKQDYAWVVIEDLKKARDESFTNGYVELTNNYILENNTYEDLQNQCQRPIVCDLETTGLDVHGGDDIKIAGVSSDRRNVRVYIWTPDVSAILGSFLSNPDNLFINHNAYLFDVITVKRCPYCQRELVSKREKFLWSCDACEERRWKRVSVALNWLKRRSE